MALYFITGRSTIRAKPAFRDSVGGFNRIRFEQVLAKSGLSEQSYVTLTRRNLVRQQLISSVQVGVQSSPRVLADRLYRYRRETRIANYIVLENDRTARIDKYVEPERREIVQIVFDDKASAERRNSRIFPRSNAHRS